MLEYDPAAFAAPATDIDTDVDAAWSLCRALSRIRRAGGAVLEGAYRVVPSPTGDAPRLAETTANDPSAAVVRRHGQWSPGRRWHGAAADMLDLYWPMLALDASRRFVIGHLGQSIDGRIATRSGNSCHLSGDGNLDHLHRLRALADAVLVGAATARLDDPRLTTRRVPGNSPVRVVIDPSARLPGELNLFHDEAAPTVVACARDIADVAIARWGASRVIAVAAVDGELDLAELLDRLADAGLPVAFVEGGGITVTRFLQARCLDRLQVAVSPVIVGDGRAGLQLPGVATIGDCARPPYRVFRMGEDVLWDFDLRCDHGAGTTPPPPAPGLSRIV